MKLTKEQLQEITSLAYDIQSQGRGQVGFPYVSIQTSNFGTCIMVSIMDKGFNKYEMETEYEFDFSGERTYLKSSYKKCVQHLKKLHEKVNELANAGEERGENSE